uniref:Coiled-coil domain-containing protein 86 n=1 Tax=Aureoumbra lagunensis TaxID=44058 RepID=A0A7S3JW15_9STRA|mmetsp:Transcript_1853/g.2468  ORF Transcript_1853/g.2468 Transcript_1853/m.2468 type:complete len:148 (-) Transcript_1853:652-1095(-)
MSNDIAVRLRGRPVSGRTWKHVETKRSSSIKAKAVIPSWSSRSAEREARKLIKEKESELIAARKERLASAKKRREEKKARRQKNEFKSSSYQVISNQHTVKALSKKQMRMIKRTRMSKEGQIELVGAYAPTLGDATSAPPSKKRQRR